MVAPADHSIFPADWLGEFLVLRQISINTGHTANKAQQRQALWSLQTVLYEYQLEVFHFHFYPD
jgi:hypothetical protein